MVKEDDDISDDCKHGVCVFMDTAFMSVTACQRDRAKNTS